MKEIKDRLECISHLLKEIEDIMCKQNEYKSSPTPKTAACICTSGRGSDPRKCAQIRSDKKENNTASKTTKKVCPENRVKCEEFSRRRTSSVLGEFSGTNSAKNNVKKKLEKDELKNDRDVMHNNRNKQPKTCNAPKYYTHGQFVGKINGIKEKCISYFEELNNST